MWSGAHWLMHLLQPPPPMPYTHQHKHTHNHDISHIIFDVYQILTGSLIYVMTLYISITNVYCYIDYIFYFAVIQIVFRYSRQRSESMTSHCCPCDKFKLFFRKEKLILGQPNAAQGM